MSIFDSVSKTTPLAQAPVQTATVEPAKVQEKAPVVTLENKPDIIDFISKKAINPKDVNDTVTMPRAIFKGYMCFTAGTAINAIGGMLKNDVAKKTLAIAGTLISIVGTFNFVKPFLHKEEPKNAENK